MAVSSNATTISKPSVAAMKGPLIAAALLQIATTDQQCRPIPFAANIDRAEKGIIGPAIELNDMKRATTAKDHALSSAGNPNRTIEKEQASTTGANRYAQGNTAIDNPIEQELHEDIKDPQLISTTAASSNEDEAAQNEGGADSNILDTGYERIINRSYKSYPPGLPQLAAFLNSAESFAIARRFGTAHSRVLLHLSCEITAIEKELDELDKTDSNSSTKYRLRRIEYYQGWDPAQKELIDKLKLKLSEYDDLLLKDSSLRALPPASVRDHLNVFHWIYNNKPLDSGHYDFIYHRDDFVSLGKQSQNGFDDFIKACLNRWPSSRFQRLFQDGSGSQDERDKHVYLFSSERISVVAKIMAVCLAVTILLIPIFLLFLTQMSRKTTAIMVLVFVLAFAALMSLFTGAKAESVFVGTCTYCAVLVTFLGNLQGTAVAVGSS